MTRIEHDRKLLNSYFDWMVETGPDENPDDFFSSEYYRRLYPEEKLTPEAVITLITHEYSLPDTKWVNTKSKKQEYVIPRQLLMSIMSFLGGYSLGYIGGICNRDHATVLHAKKRIRNTLWNDKQYGERIQRIYQKCEEMKR